MKGRPWAICHLVVRASHRGRAGALCRLAALITGRKPAVAEVMPPCTPATTSLLPRRAGGRELVTHADFQRGRAATVFRKREGGRAGGRAAGAASTETEGGGRAHWQRDYAEGRLSVRPPASPGGEPRDGLALFFSFFCGCLGLARSCLSVPQGALGRACQRSRVARNARRRRRFGAAR